MEKSYYKSTLEALKSRINAKDMEDEVKKLAYNLEEKNQEVKIREKMVHMEDRKWKAYYIQFLIILKEGPKQFKKSYKRKLSWSKGLTRDFPGDAVDTTPRSQCRGPGFDPWSGN